MKILIDTNVIIDVFSKREPFCAASAEVLKLSDRRNMTLQIAVSQTTDIFYILARSMRDSARARAVVKNLGDNLTVIDVTAADYRRAIVSAMSDFEDALLAQCAARTKTDWIITRNLKDFKASPIPAIKPEDFLNKFFT
jgi:predicted nucleic acid-binding protein